MMPEKQNKIFGICASLGLHVLVAAVVLLGFLGYAATPQDLAKLNLMWVSVAAKEQNDFPPARKAIRTEKPAIESPARLAPEEPVVQNFRQTSAAVVPSVVAAADARTVVRAEMKTSANAAEGVYSPVSGSGRQTGAAAMMPASSNAYPLYRENPPPGYPEMARRQGYEGVVLVEAEILADGRVGQAVISKSSGYAILDQSAIQAVKAWKFAPARKSGIPHKTWAELPIKFVLNDNSQS